MNDCPPYLAVSLAALLAELKAIDDRFDSDTETAADRKRYVKILRILLLRMVKDDL